jgi:hypothetical protein
MGEKWPRILPEVANFTSLLGSFTYRKVTTWDRRLYFPSEGRRSEEFFARKNPTASAGFESANSDTKGTLPLDHRSRLQQVLRLFNSERFVWPH